MASVAAQTGSVVIDDGCFCNALILRGPVDARDGGAAGAATTS